MSDPLGDLAHIITGCIAATCCHRTGGYNSDPTCECRDIAVTLIENKDRVLEIYAALDGEKK